MKEQKKTYDYVIVGAGLYGAVFAYILKHNGKRCLVIDKRNYAGGNIYCEKLDGINIHQYGPHIFHTNNKEIWTFVNSLVEFNNFIYSPLAYYKGHFYNLPFNMNTFYQLWGTATPDQAKGMIEKQAKTYGFRNPRNLEEQALSIVGFDLYQTLIKGYTEKQWGRDAKKVPAFIIKRIPLRYTFNNNYFNDKYQGIPIGGYNLLISKLLEKTEIRLNTNFFENKKYFENIAEKILYTGRIDEFYNYAFGKLEYRSLYFETKALDIENYQGNAAVNYTCRDIPYTRIIEHKHFELEKHAHTVITKEYPAPFDGKNEPYYPINDNINNKIFLKYKTKANNQIKYLFGGRLGNYKYYDMDDTIDVAIQHAKAELANNATNISHKNI
jgi:UDP-galactopyranose mutase